MAPPLCQIVGVGARGPLGLNALQVVMGARAGTMEPRRTPFTDKHGNSIGAVRARFLPDDLVGYDRLVALAVPALREAARALVPGAFAPPYPLFLALAEAGRPDDDSRFGPEILADLARRSGLPIDLERSVVVRAGHAGVGLALELAALRLAEGGRPRAYLVGGVDSYYHPAVLAWLDAECRLHAGTAGNGLVPSEGAAFAVVTAAAEDSAARALARVAAVASGREDTVGTAAPNLATAMTRAVRAAATLAGGGPIRWLVTDVNGERHRISELAKVQIRSRDLLAEDARHDALPDDLGDVGAASGALLLAAACVHFRAGSAPASRVLIALHAEAHERAVLVLDAADPERLPAAPASASALFRAGVDVPVVHAALADLAAPLVTAELTALRDLARGCMEDVAILGGLRRPNDDEPWAATDRFERRLLASVDALAALDRAEGGPTEGIDVPAALLAYAGESSFADGGRAFTRAFGLACFGGDAPMAGAIAGLRASHSLTRPAQLDAFCLAPSPRVVPAMEQLLWDADPALVRLALDVLRFRRAVPLAALLPLLSHPDLGVLEAAARALRVALPRAEAVTVLEGLLHDGGLEDRVVLVVLESLVALGAPAGVTLAQHHLVDGDARPGGLSTTTRLGLVRLLALAGGLDHTALIFNAVIPARAAPALPAGVTALGWFGHAAFVAPLLDQLDAANAAPRTTGARPTDLEIAIARALLRITGVYLEEAGNAYGIGLSVDGAAWRAHWHDHPAALDPDVRYRFGVRYHPRESVTELADASTSALARRNAALEIAALTRGAFGFEPTDWVARQREHLTVVGDALTAGASAYEPGEWLAPYLARRRLTSG
jgi:3-oxoacyl-[acyl-carrier-protein] synthase-1